MRRAFAEDNLRGARLQVAAFARCCGLLQVAKIPSCGEKSECGVVLLCAHYSGGSFLTSDGFCKNFGYSLSHIEHAPTGQSEQ
jgi:hypothetical protein